MAKSIRWIYPLNWDGEYELDRHPHRGWKRMVVQLSFYDESAQGAAETDVTKLARADFRGVDGRPCYKLCIEKIEYATYGMLVHLEWDMNPHQHIFLVPESQEGTANGPWLPEITEPGGYLAGETGDLLITTVNNSQYDSYEITLYLKIKTMPHWVGSDPVYGE